MEKQTAFIQYIITQHQGPYVYPRESKVGRGITIFNGNISYQLTPRTWDCQVRPPEVPGRSCMSYMSSALWGDDHLQVREFGTFDQSFDQSFDHMGTKWGSLDS